MGEVIRLYGVALVDAETGFYLTDYENTDVYFSNITDEEMVVYQFRRTFRQSGPICYTGRGALVEN